MHLATSGYRFHWLLQAVQVPHHEAIHNCPQTPTITPQLFEDAKMHWLISRFHREQTSCGLEGSANSLQTRCKLFKVLTSASRIAPPNNFNALPKTARPRRIWGTQSKYSKIITTNPVPSAKSRLVQHDETSPGFQYIEISAATWERLIPYECLADMAGVWWLRKKNGDLWVLVFFDGLCLVSYNSWLEKTNCLSMHSGAQQRWSLAGNACDGHSHKFPILGHLQQIKCLWKILKQTRNVCIKWWVWGFFPPLPSLVMLHLAKVPSWRCH